jgi:hypothetical protein
MLAGSTTRIIRQDLKNAYDSLILQPNSTYKSGSVKNLGKNRIVTIIYVNFQTAALSSSSSSQP